MRNLLCKFHTAIHTNHGSESGCGPMQSGAGVSRVCAIHARGRKWVHIFGSGQCRLAAFPQAAGDVMDQTNFHSC